MIRWLLLLVTLGLSACATRPVAPPAGEAQWREHAAAVGAWQAWELQGRVALQVGEDGWQAALTWRQFPDQYQMTLSGPFGQGGARLDGREGLVRFRQGDRNAVASDAETLLLQELGWRLPVSGLRYWVRGLPAVATAAISLDAEGRLATLSEDGWQIRFQRYGSYEGADLPTKLQLDNGDVRVKLVVQSWRRLSPGGEDDG